MCNCIECQLLQKIWNVHDSLSYERMWGGKGLLSRYKYEDENKERAHQEGLEAGWMFQYNETIGTKFNECVVGHLKY